MDVARTEDDLAPHRGGVLVPTMGALHAGHRALIEHARALAGEHALPGVVVSIFVNPAQFDEQGDFDSYPRHLESDLDACRALGVACALAPDVDAVYPPGELDRPLDLPPVATEPGLEDRYRPGHFAGVARVCRRLLEMSAPRFAVFGAKDWQQLQVVREVARREQLGAEIVAHPTVREADGMALSSRNERLDPAQRGRALGISRALEEARRHADPADAERAGLEILRAHEITPDYLAVRDAETLLAPRPGRPGRVLAAGRVGDVRLIDNEPWPA